MKILVVDDERLERRLIEKTLARLGHEIVTAGGGAEAWEEIKNKQIRFVITDWNMPGVDGIQLIQKIRSSQLSGYIYVILVTSNDRSEEVVAGLYSGADDYLTKPFNPAELEARVAVGERVLTLEDNLVRAKNQLEKLAMVDTLTGLMNRRAIYKFTRGELERARRIADPISVIFLDIDKFKTVNDTYGHLVGDDALKMIAQVIRQRSRAYDGIGRWAGDEFLVVLPGARLQDADKAAKRIVEGIATTPLVLPDNTSIHIHASAGVAVLQKMNNSPSLLDDLIQAADEALYRAKAAGGDAVEVTWL
jgi:two-component system cell cycle response regulator